MKRYIPGISAFLFALVLSTSLSGSTQSNGTEDEFIWHEYNYAGTAELYPAVTYEGTMANAKIMFTCPDYGFRVCARAYNFLHIPTDLFLMKE